MATFNILAGDFTAQGHIRRNKLVLRRRLTFSTFLRTLSTWERVPIGQIASLQIATEESSKSFGGATVAGLVGGALLGGAGLVAGALLGGNKKAVTFELRLMDGRGLLGTCDPKTFQQLQAAAFKAA